LIPMAEKGGWRLVVSSPSVTRAVSASAVKKAVASALGVPRDEVTSPTFVLVNQYRGSQPVIHIDAYRLRDDDEFLELGPEEFFESDALVLVEWADRFPTIIPDERLEIQIESTGEQTRAFSIAATGERYLSTVDRLRELLRPV